ncbi:MULTISPECIES: polyprenyl synthetase family protein [unclassified Facklamia]|uniref:polyprenyl synthetase family protein n=1 Tax=Aerococcaceae TaxID=186827 RepID=UPI0013BD527A|nr:MULTISPECIES: farnesyl diphosphate synthase [unclassified Facklamia]MBS4461504.1 polyprenyl synthetase family protein [Aerococcaceae bacterium zg-B36]NEW63797.1 polyprenyl synthetase family protein [Facklamia sp. 252]NEW67268.1 polyprenyl synthetase family protein [Facklamia sp. 253]QQD65150.1 polyprenyl synthetase family protein [Aerococcaceae bacterium zg-252]
MSILTFDNFREIFNRGLEQTTRYETTPIELMEPMIYSLLNGGKRVRPVMLLWVLGIQGIDSVKLGLKTAIALEYIHTYSLIHDDLPAMDNDDYRRGHLTSHKKFGEATAILTGDALLTDSFNLIATDDFLTAEQKVQIVHLLSQAAGSVGMVAGQMSDIQSEGQSITLEQLARIHYLKTGKLFLFAVQAASVIAELPIEVQEQLEQFAAHFGRAFQIHNDIMDEIGTLDTTGKQTQADSALEKATYPSLLSLKGAKQALSDEVAQAMKILETLTVQTGKDYQSLAQFLSFVSVE